MTFEVGIRNAGLGLLLVFTSFQGLGGMALVAAWWGIWDIIAALTVARIWRRRAPREATEVVGAAASAHDVASPGSGRRGRIIAAPTAS